jgi:uncharacterized protein (UPF0332 family)
VTELFEPEIEANLKRAEESVQAARTLIKEGYFDFAASRAYYAAFYGAAAALLSQDLEYSKHSAVIAAVHQKLIKPGRLDRRYSRELKWLFELRSIGDYGETRHVPPEDAQKAIDTAEGFLSAIKKLLRRK